MTWTVSRQKPARSDAFGGRFGSGPYRASDWAGVDFFCPSRIPQPRSGRRVVLGRTIVPTFTWPRRYALHWQIVMWLGCIVLALINHS